MAGLERYDENEVDPVFRTVVTHWLTKIKHAKDHKKKVFGEAADECRSFYNGPRDWDAVMGGHSGGLESSETVDPAFKVSINKTFEFVTIFGPSLYFENPVRTVKPRMPVVIPPAFFGADMMLYQSMVQEENARVMTDGLRSVLLECYLNWTPVEFHLGEESRAALEEALITGRGCLWTELYSPPGSTMNVVRSTMDSVNHLLCDPDGEKFEKCMWVARECIHPVWQVERDFGLRRGSIKGNLESQAKQSDIQSDEDGEYNRRQGRTNDLLRYWKIYSKMGIGGRLQGIRKELREPLEMFGDYCYLVVADTVNFPLNLPPDVMHDPAFASDPNAIFSKVAWPTPFWGQDDWPVSPLDFHLVSGCPWPLAHLKAAMGELKFLNWANSMLMGKLRISTRDFIAIKKEAGEEIKAAIAEGKDLTLLEIENGHGTISEIVQILQHPEVNGDIWKMIEAVEANFDKRTGLNELMYGAQGPTQIRSAEEYKGRTANMNVRPDDMRKVVEAWMARVSAKEALCARYHLTPTDVKPVFGTMGALAWGRFVATRDLGEACHQLEYRIESGSTARPNKEWEIQTINQAFQQLAPIFQTYAQQTMDMRPLNNLVAAVAKSLDLDPAQFQLTTPMMPPAPPQPGDDGSGGVGHQSQATTNVPPPG